MYIQFVSLWEFDKQLKTVLINTSFHLFRHRHSDWFMYWLKHLTAVELVLSVRWCYVCVVTTKTHSVWIERSFWLFPSGLNDLFIVHFSYIIATSVKFPIEWYVPLVVSRLFILISIWNLIQIKWTKIQRLRSSLLICYPMRSNEWVIIDLTLEFFPIASRIFGVIKYMMKQQHNFKNILIQFLLIYWLLDICYATVRSLRNS